MVRRRVLVHTTTSVPMRSRTTPASVRRVRAPRIAERRVAADAPEHVELALAVPREPHAARLHVQVEQEVDDAREQVALDAVEHHLAPDVDDLDEAPLVLADLLVGALVVGDAQAEVAHGLLLGHALVVGRARLGGADVRLDERRVAADRLDEDDLEPFGLASRAHERAALARVVRRVVDGDVAAAAEEREHVVERGEGDLAARLLACFVARVEEGVALPAAEALRAGRSPR